MSKMKSARVSSPLGLKITRDGSSYEIHAPFDFFGTVMLMANGAGAQNSVKPFHLDEATISDVHRRTSPALSHP